MNGGQIMSVNIIPMPNKIFEYDGEKVFKEKDFFFEKKDGLGEEDYELLINQDGVFVSYSTDKGRFYAGKTLEQLKKKNGSLPFIRISDSPRFSRRAFMIDSARHMQSVDEIKKYIEAAALYKFNVFHWHLTDDQGWRVEIEKYPELTRVGAFRNGHGFGSKNKAVYGGYYTKDEIRDIVEFCRERYIDVIPEIDMPGHMIAAIASYPELSCGGKSIGVELNPGVHRTILCAGNEKVFDFCFDVIDEVCELFPYEYFHIGGDEAPKNRWDNCPKCKERIREEGLKNSEELQGYFVNRIIGHLKEKGKKAVVWNESLKSKMLQPGALVSDWMDKEHLCEDWANSGGKIIIEDFFHYYLDYNYGITPLKKTYSFNPMLEKLDIEGRKSVMGVETPIWTEFVENFDRLCYLCFPRMMAVAESGWTNWGRRNYRDFVRRAEANRRLLLSMGINMAPKKDWDPLPFGRIKDQLSHYTKFLTRENLRCVRANKKEDREAKKRKKGGAD